MQRSISAIWFENFDDKSFELGSGATLCSLTFYNLKANFGDLVKKGCERRYKETKMLFINVTYSSGTKIDPGW